MVLCVTFSGVYAQDVYNSSGSATGYKHKKKQKGYDPSKLIIGATFNAFWSGDFANFGLGPTVGYKLTNELSAGVGLGYQFNKVPDFYALPDVNGNYPALKENLIYPSLWAKYQVWGNIFVDANFEYDLININGYNVQYDANGNAYNVSAKFNTAVPCLLVGVGLRQPMGGRLAGFLEVLYDVMQQRYSPYAQEFPVVRFGITTGL